MTRTQTLTDFVLVNTAFGLSLAVQVGALALLRGAALVQPGIRASAS